MKKYTLTLSIIVLSVLVSGAVIVKANSSFFLGVAASSSSTTTPTFIQPGLATTTYAFDAYATSQPRPADKAALLVQYMATSAAPVVNINIEYAQDNPTGVSCITFPTACDWYQSTPTVENGYATSSTAFDITQVPFFRWTFASSTAGLVGVAQTAATTTRILSIQTPARYVRAIFTVPIGAGYGAVWAQWLPQRQAIQ